MGRTLEGEGRGEVEADVNEEDRKRDVIHDQRRIKLRHARLSNQRLAGA